MKNSEPINLYFLNRSFFSAMLCFLVCFPLSIYAQESTCTYQLRLVDSFGDGWDDSFVSISNGGVVENFTLGDGDDDGGLEVIDFSIVSGSTLTLRYGTDGTPTFQSEISYSLLDSEGFIVFQDGPSPANGLVYTTEVLCPTCAALSQNDAQITNVTASTASITWDGIATDDVLIEYGPLDFELGTGQQVTVTGTSTTLDNLAENTDYAVYISRLCSGGDRSRSLGPFFLKTNFLNPPDTCFYTLRLLDLFGDGWNGASMTVMVNGVVETYTLPEGFRADVPIPALSNFPLQIDFNGGPFDEEVSYIILGTDGETITSDGPSPRTGRVADLIACPSCPIPDSLHIDASALRATINWEDLTEVPTYVLEYGKKGFELGTGLEVVVQDTFTTLTSLEEKTDYEVYLLSECSQDERSVLTLGPIAFQTGYLKDVGIDRITMPVTNCGLGISEMIEVELKNYGADPQSLIPFKFSVNGVDGGVPIPTDGFYTGIISKDSITSIQFETPTDLMTTGIYEIAVWTELEGDSDTGNDTAVVVVTNIPNIQTFPYSENFSDGAGGWTVNTTDKSSWEFGQPKGEILTRAFSGQEAWVTNLDGPYQASEVSYLVSPCMDFSSLTSDPLIAFRYFFNTPLSGDTKAWLELSKNGERWTRVGKEGLNWYNEDGQTNWGGNASLGTWLYAEDSLANTAGVEDIRLRFVFASDASVTTTDGFAIDDIHIIPSGVPNMVARLAFNAARDGCGSPTDSVSLLLRNSGLDTVRQLEVGYQIDNQPIVTESLDTILRPGGSITYTFQTDFNSTAIGTYRIKSWVNLSGDAAPISDTTYTYFEVFPPNPLPLLEDFEDTSVDDGWVALQGGGNFIGADDHNNETIILATNMWFGSPVLEFITANYGPINEGDSLSFDYRFADWPNATIGKVLAGDSLQLAISTDCGNTYQAVYTVHEGNHEPTADFTKITISLEEYIGQGVVFKFLTTWGEGDYWFDIDNINVLGCPTNLGLRAEVTDATGADQADGSIQIIPTQGAGDYTYEWQITGENTDAIGNLMPGDYRVKVTDALLGCEDFLTVSVGILTTSINDLPIIEELNVYPNPTNGSAQLFLQLYESQLVDLQVFNAMGQVVTKLPPTSTNVIRQDLNLTEYPKGMYWLRINIGNQQVTRKLVKW